MSSITPAVLLDIDGVLYVGDAPIAGAIAALEELRGLSAGVRLVTNTTSKSRREIVEHLRLLVGEALQEDLAELAGTERPGAVDAVVLGDLGEGFTADVLNEAFRLLMDGAELVALQHNRYWRRADGLVLDVGAYSAALEYASGREAVVVGKPAPAFFLAALADLNAQPEAAVMVGDDVEADVGGAIDAGLRGILVRTGKYRKQALQASGVEPSEIVDSIADVPGLLR